ncbi:hypothetical protein [Escherichia phage pEC-M2929-1AR.1]|nr:hypothetical protein [Escherichia phage pEC-M2929-1AR.1]
MYHIGREMVSRQIKERLTLWLSLLFAYPVRLGSPR